MTDHLPRFTFAGSPEQMGRQHGLHCRELVLRHLDLLKERFEVLGIPFAAAAVRALAYREHVRTVSPDLDRELEGLAEGAGIGIGEAYLLQLRAEIHADLFGDLQSSNECTTFAFEPVATAAGGGIVGQNADLPGMYADLLVVAEFRPEEGPAILMVVPAGQISYIGINDAGLAAFANFLTCDGWRTGYPRYLFTRLALQQPSLDAAVELIESLERASSRNLLLYGGGASVDLENTPDRVVRITSDAGRLFHSNHYLLPDFAEDERSEGQRLANSRIRYRRIAELAAETPDGEVTVPRVAEIMRDRQDPQNALSVEQGDRDAFGDYMTVCGVIAEPEAGRLWVSAGPPSQHPYAAVGFSGASLPDALV